MENTNETIKTETAIPAAAEQPKEKKCCCKGPMFARLPLFYKVCAGFVVAYVLTLIIFNWAIYFENSDPASGGRDIVSGIVSTLYYLVVGIFGMVSFYAVSEIISRIIRIEKLLTDKEK